MTCKSISHRPSRFRPPPPTRRPSSLLVARPYTFAVMSSVHSGCPDPSTPNRVPYPPCTSTMFPSPTLAPHPRRQPVSFPLPQVLRALTLRSRRTPVPLLTLSVPSPQPLLRPYSVSGTGTTCSFSPHQVQSATRDSRLHVGLRSDRLVPRKVVGEHFLVGRAGLQSRRGGITGDG